MSRARPQCLHRLTDASTQHKQPNWINAMWASANHFRWPQPEASGMERRGAGRGGTETSSGEGGGRSATQRQRRSDVSRAGRTQSVEGLAPTTSGTETQRLEYFFSCFTYMLPFFFIEYSLFARLSPLAPSSAAGERGSGKVSRPN